MRAASRLGLNRASEVDCARLLVALALQHNGFGSGLYLQLAMVNHTCYAPNCIKTSPTGATAWASELWTIRDVRAGEQLFISYAQPLEELTRAQVPHEWIMSLTAMYNPRSHPKIPTTTSNCHRHICPSVHGASS